MALTVNTNFQDGVTGIRDADFAKESLIDDMMTGVRNAEGYSEVEWTFIGDNLGGTATQLQENCANGTFVKGGQLGYTEVEWTFIGDNVGSTAGPGGSTFPTGYSEAVGLDSSTGMPGVNGAPGNSVIIIWEELI